VFKMNVLYLNDTPAARPCNASRKLALCFLPSWILGMKYTPLKTKLCTSVFVVMFVGLGPVSGLQLVLTNSGA
jgi:hypothetical protein